MMGTPDQDSLLFPGQQSYMDTCAIRCQEFLIEQFTGAALPEHVYVQEAREHGWYTPSGGTRLQDVGNLMELHGIPVHRYEHANIFHLSNELAQGHKVIIGVDSEDLWHQHPILDHLRDMIGMPHQADHAVVVSGIDPSNPADVHVIVSDPGTGEAMARYPMGQFLEAWKASDFFMVTTQEPAPSHLPEMAHFDYHLGHIPEVNGIPYEQFLAFAQHPEAWEQLVAPDAAHFDAHALHHGAWESHSHGGGVEDIAHHLGGVEDPMHHHFGAMEDIRLDEQ